MPVLVKPNDNRGPEAIILVLRQREWREYWDHQDRHSWSIPSMTRPGLFYRTTDGACSCQDARYRPWTSCKHQLAIRMWDELKDEEKYAF